MLVEKGRTLAFFVAPFLMPRNMHGLSDRTRGKTVLSGGDCMWYIFVLTLLVPSFAGAADLPKEQSQRQFFEEALEPLAEEVDVVLFSGWKLLDGETLSGVGLDYDDIGRLHLIVRGTDSGLLYRSRSSAGIWSAWTSLGGSTFFDPDITYNPVTGEIQVFVTGIDSFIYQNTRSPAGIWSGWSAVPFGVTTHAVGAATNDLGETTIIVKDIAGTNIWVNDGGIDTSPGGDLCVTKTVGVVDSSGDLADFTTFNPCTGNALTIKIVTRAANTGTFSVCQNLLTLVQSGVQFTSSNFSWIKAGTSSSLCEDLLAGTTTDSVVTLRPGAALDLRLPFSMNLNGDEFVAFP